MRKTMAAHVEAGGAGLHALAKSALERQRRN
jgi:hypothetical protein